MVGKGTGINSMFSDFNIFSELLSLEKMVAITTSGAKECGSRGDLLNWEEAEWTLSDKWANGEWSDWVLVVNASKLVEVTKEDLKWLWHEVDHLPMYSASGRPVMGYLWLSATEGDSGETYQ